MSNEQNKKWTSESWIALDYEIEVEGGGFVIEDLGYDGLYVHNASYNIPRIVACVNFLQDHPDLSAVEVIDKAELHDGDGFIYDGEKFIKVAPTMETYALLNRNRQLAEMTAQRDSLLAAIQWALDDAINGVIRDAGVSKIRAAIAGASK